MALRHSPYESAISWHAGGSELCVSSDQKTPDRVRAKQSRKTVSGVRLNAIMFGSLRLFLAFCVALSHLGFSVHGFNPGVFAVVLFYLISGFVTASLLDNQFRTPVDYYKERALRLLPSYWIALGSAAAIWYFVRPDSYFLSRYPGWEDWFANITIIPLNFYMWTGQDAFTLIPPAWSLGAELQFYIVSAWILRSRGQLLPAMIIGSLILWLMAQIGFLNSDWWGYRLLPGIIFIFLVGASVFRRNHYIAASVWTVAVALGIGIITGMVPIMPFNVETSTGIMVGIPLLALLCRFHRRNWDDALGKIAYPVFLLHFPVSWAFFGFGVKTPDILPNPGLLSCWILVLILSSVALYFIAEAPFTHLRHLLRKKSHGAKTNLKLG